MSSMSVEGERALGVSSMSVEGVRALGGTSESVEGVRALGGTSGSLTDTECDGLAGSPGSHCAFVSDTLSLSPHYSVSPHR